MDYLGGIYVSQVEANNKEDAVKNWIINLDVSQIDNLTEADKKKQINEGFIGDYKPVLLKGLINVWCIDMKTQKGFAIITFSKTER
jgi:hypothetical protein